MRHGASVASCECGEVQKWKTRSLLMEKEDEECADAEVEEVKGDSCGMCERSAPRRCRYWYLQKWVGE